MPKPTTAAKLVLVSVTNGIATFSTKGTKAGPSAQLTQWQLDPGDGTNPADGFGPPPQQVTHKYKTTGTFSAKLFVVDDKGNRDDDTVLVAVAAVPPIEPPIEPPVEPPVEPPIDPPQVAGNLLGGWRLAEEFARGAIAIDFSRMKLWMVGHAQRNEILEYNLPAMGVGPDIGAWPAVYPTAIHNAWWPLERGYANGLIFWRGKVWVAPRVFYAQDVTIWPDTVLYAQDGETLTLPNLPENKFAGFLKRGPNLDPLIGCGGYESGQGSQSGPSMATLAGVPLLQYGFVGEPGPNLEYWDQRAPRATNFFPVGGMDPRQPGYQVLPGVDSWVAWQVRPVGPGGALEGRWASDRLYSGGLVLPDGVHYWAWMATGGPVNYANQTYTFVGDQDNRTYRYRYTHDGQFIDFQSCPQFDWMPILGQELGPDGEIYLAQGSIWQSGAYVTDVAVRVFG